MVTIEIMWDDLTEDAQKRIQKALNITDNGNWDVIPMAVLEIETDLDRAVKEIDRYSQGL